jgi:hypothetical protein
LLQAAAVAVVVKHRQALEAAVAAAALVEQ